MMNLIQTSEYVQINTINRLKRSYKKFVKNKPALQKSIDETVSTLAENPLSPSLLTHKLSGELFELFACKCGYDCRILFSFEEAPKINEKVIILVDIGTHEDVY